MLDDAFFFRQQNIVLNYFYNKANLKRDFLNVNSMKIRNKSLDLELIRSSMNQECLYKLREIKKESLLGDSFSIQRVYWSRESKIG